MQPPPTKSLPRFTQLALRLLIVSAIVPIAACGTRMVSLSYPPGASDDAAIVPPLTDEPTLIDVVISVFDARTDKVQLGNAGGGMTSEPIETKDDVSAWVENAIAYELNRHGYNVLRDGSDVESDAALKITADIQRIDSQARYLYDAQVLLQATLEKNNESPRIDQYEGKGSAGIWHKQHRVWSCRCRSR